MNKTQVRQIFKKARRIVKHPGLDLLIAPTALPSGELVVITPGAIGNAVVRNRIRRRIKALFHEEKLDQKGFDCIVIIKKPGTATTIDQLKEIILNAFTVRPDGARSAS